MDVFHVIPTTKIHKYSTDWHLFCKSYQTVHSSNCISHKMFAKLAYFNQPSNNSAGPIPADHPIFSVSTRVYYAKASPLGGHGLFSHKAIPAHTPLIPPQRSVFTHSSAVHMALPSDHKHHEVFHSYLINSPFCLSFVDVEVSLSNMWWPAAKELIEQKVRSILSTALPINPINWCPDNRSRPITTRLAQDLMWTMWTAMDQRSPHILTVILWYISFSLLFVKHLKTNLLYAF